MNDRPAILVTGGAGYIGSHCCRALTAAGFEVTYLSHYNFILFPAIATARLIGRVVRGRRELTNGHHDLTMPSAPLNRMLFELFSAERRVVGKIRIPLGVSLIALARA